MGYEHVLELFQKREHAPDDSNSESLLPQSVIVHSSLIACLNVKIKQESGAA